MKIVVDTSIWSLALRREQDRLSHTQQSSVTRLKDLIRDDKVVLLGPVRQELLSGIRSVAVFERLRQELQNFSDEDIEIEDYEEAARCSNRCRARGVAATAIDILICAFAVRRNYSLFADDNDFAKYADVLNLNLYSA